MNVYELLAGDASITIKMVTGETFVTVKRDLDEDGEWLSIRPFRKFMGGHEYPMNEPLVVLSVAHIAWIGQAK